MSVTSTVNAINAQTLKYLPATLAAIQAAEHFAPEGATGSDKLGAVLAAVGAGSAELAGSDNPNVASVAGLINLSVTIANIFGAFKHKAKT